MIKTLIASAFIASTLAACGGGGDDSPANISGTWTGTSVYTLGGTISTDTITAVLNHTGTDVTGALTSSSGFVGAFNNAKYSGEAGAAITGNIIPYNTSQCPYKFTGTYSDNKISGTATTYNCTVIFDSKINMTR